MASTLTQHRLRSVTIVGDEDHGLALQPSDLRRREPIGAAEDSISAGIGSPVYVTSHVLTGTDDSMAVNRFYFEAAPPVAVDFADETTEDDAEEKAAWCAEHGVRYLLADDETLFADPAGLRRSLNDGD